MKGKVMKKVAVVLCLVFWMADVQADLSSFPICENTSPQSAPAVDGNLAVWVDYRDGSENANIYGRLLPGVTELEICKELGNQTAPAVSGSIIVWQDDRKGNVNDYDVYGYDVNAGQSIQVCTDSANQQNPDISGSIVVWQEYNGSNWDIYGINLDGGAKFAICTTGGDQQYPAISGHYVVWQDNRGGGYDIYCRDLNAPAGSDFKICGASGDQLYPDIDGNLIVWQDPRTDSNNDIYGYELGVGEFPVCVRAEKQSQPMVAGNRIVWRDRRNNAATGYDIYEYNYSTKTETPICTISGTQDTPAVSSQYVVWRDAVNNGDIYGAAFPVVASITVISPNGGETLIGGRQQQVQWNSQGTISTVKIELYNGTSWQTIVDGVANTGSLNITVPAGINSQQCLVKVSDAANASVADQSDVVFTIFQCMLKADLTGDCYVDLADFAEFAKQWLVCGNPFDAQWCQNN
jgi:beta propeller repeat protein